MDPLLFESTNQQAPAVNLREALLKGQAPDRGLYLPRRFPRLEPEQIASFSRLKYAEIAALVLGRYTRGILDSKTLAKICEDAYPFEVPLEQVYGRVHVMRLDRGPTASFKDFAARFMARVISHFLAETGGQLAILTATSGDTGSAIASAFHGLENIRIIVLFPREEVSAQQRRQMTTLRGNVQAIAVDGKFDDCQALVKQAFCDEALADLPLSSANSINIGRLLPQTIYYFYAASRLATDGRPLVFVVPSGNFGNMMGAVIADRMGLPIRRLVIPVNGNDAFPQFLKTGVYQKIEPSRNCLSNAMNVGHPSNLARLVAAYGGWMDEKGYIHKAPNIKQMRQDIYSVSISDGRTREVIQEAWQQHRLLLEPHGAVGWGGFVEYLKMDSLGETPAVVLETAHPAKFPDTIKEVLGISPPVPPALERLDGMPEFCEHLGTKYSDFREYLRQTLNPLSKAPADGNSLRPA